MVAARILSGFRRIESNKTVDVAATPHGVAVDNFHSDGRRKESLCALGQFGRVKLRYKARPSPDDNEKNQDAGRDPGRCNRNALDELPTSAGTAVDVLCHLRRPADPQSFGRLTSRVPMRLRLSRLSRRCCGLYLPIYMGGLPLGVAFVPAAPAYPDTPGGGVC